MYWAFRRKMVYALALITAIIAGGVFFSRDILFPEPTCMDNKLNGFETGVDCGGSCALICTQDVNPLVVSWAKAVPIGSGLYDLVGMIRNTNINNASHELGYTFTAYGDQGETLITLSSSTTAPLDGNFPVIMQNVPLSAQPKTVSLTLTDGKHYSVKESPTSPTVRTLERRYEAGPIPRLYATVVNTKRVEINNLAVRAVLFDQNDNVYAVGQTVIPFLGKEEAKEITFTWNQALPFAPTKIGVYPIFNPFEAIGY